MAKRKRLTPANPSYLPEDGSKASSAPLETKARFPSYKDGWAGSRAAPISAVAGDAAATAALTEMADTLAQARTTGRLVLDLPLEAIKADYLTRDRSHMDADEMAALMESLRARGQQTPIEVVDLCDGTFGLISGFRRLEGLRRLQAEGAEIESIQALLRRPEDTPAAYVAMVEENEVRANLSFYERARLIVQAVDKGVFEDEKQALKRLFQSAPRARRSKIGSFVIIARALEGSLQFPQSLSEKNGLALSKALSADADLAARIQAAILAAKPQNGAEEAALIAREIENKELSLSIPLETKLDSKPESNVGPEIAPGLRLKSTKGKIELSGVAVTPDLEARLIEWLKRG